VWGGTDWLCWIVTVLYGSGWHCFFVLDGDGAVGCGPGSDYR
jgi:hypothetical protein